MTGSDQFREMFDKADELYEAGDFAAATELYTALLNENPDDEDALLARSAAHYAMHQYRFALDDCSRILERNPYNSRAAYNAGLAGDMLDDRTSAIDFFTQAIDAEPDFANAYAAIANVYYEAEEFETAVSYYDSAASLGCDFEDLALWWGKALAQVGRYEEALEVYEEHPEAYTSAALRSAIGQCLYLLGRDEAALPLLQEAVEDPDDHDSLLCYIALCRLHGESRRDIESLVPSVFISGGLA